MSTPFDNWKQKFFLFLRVTSEVWVFTPKWHAFTPGICKQRAVPRLLEVTLGSHAAHHWGTKPSGLVINVKFWSPLIIFLTSSPSPPPIQNLFVPIPPRFHPTLSLHNLLHGASYSLIFIYSHPWPRTRGFFPQLKSKEKWLRKLFLTILSLDALSCCC